MTKFYVDDIPENLTVFQFLKANTDWHEVKEACRPGKNYPSVMEFGIKDFDLTTMQDTIKTGYELYGSYGWQSSESEMKEYSGVSLTFNRNHQDSLDPHRSSLGTAKNSKSEFFYGKTSNHSLLKNSYFDSYSFNTKTPFMEHQYLGEFSHRFKRTQIRSRCSTINPEFMDQSKPPAKGWHRDEEIFENIRVNIPITSYPTYFFEIQGTEKTHLNVGSAYSFDSNIPHSVFTTEFVPVTRTNLVLGFSPWFDYNQEDNSWEINEFWGKHPFDMLVDGDIISGLELK